MFCEVHGIPLICYCPACRGEVRSARKKAAAMANGKRGGRPKKNKALSLGPEEIAILRKLGLDPAVFNFPPTRT